MKLLVLSARDVRALLGYGECAAAMRSALTALQAGRAQMPLRTIIQPDGAAGLIGLMPSYLAGGGESDGDPAYGLKAVCVTPGNPAAGLDAHQGVVLVSSGVTGEPLALVNASAITEIRTAAVSVVATELLARPEADVLAVVGTGLQGRAHALALDQARPLREIRLAGRTQARAAELAGSLRDQVRARVVACASASQAVAGAGIVVTATSSPEPVLRAGWLAPGTHVNAVGSSLPRYRELDTGTMAAGVLFADRRESLLTESGDYLFAAADGAVSPADVRAELGEVLTGAAPGRLTADEITIFDSLGLAVEDLAAARRAYQKAAATGAGSWVEF
jgi:ornithine cyclodeaminase/alanine dehydrogenase-like protein (mu-crystallin family)